jgi:hypothetical protein
MGRPKRVHDCKTTEDFERVARQQGGYIYYGRRHDLIYREDRGPAVLPRHTGELSKGMRCSLRRVMLCLGFWLLCLSCPCALFALALH